MIEMRLVEKVKRGLSQGKSVQQLKKNLTNEGHDYSKVNEAISYVDFTRIKELPTISKYRPKKRKRKLTKIIGLILFAIFLGLSAIYFGTL